MAVLPYGEVEPKAGSSLYRYCDTDAWLTLENTEYDPPEGYDAVFQMESEVLHTLCVAIVERGIFSVRWWPLDNVSPEWVAESGLDMLSATIAKRIFPGLKAWTFGVIPPTSS